MTANFTLDTSGEVWMPSGPLKPPMGYTFGTLDPFTQGYVKALFRGMGLDGGVPFLTHQHPDGRSAGRHVGFSDLAPETMALILRDCGAFGRAVGKDDLAHNSGLGARFWESRQSRFSSLWSLHQAEFNAAFPPLTPYLGDDGKVYLREAG